MKNTARFLAIASCLAASACSGATLHQRAIEHNARAAELIEEGSLGQARASLEVALEYNPRFAEAHANLGLIDLREGRLDDAAQRLQRAVLLNPDFAEAWTNLAGLSLSRGQPAEAVVQARQAVEVDPDFAEGRIALIRALLLTGAPADAVEASTQARRLLAVRPSEARSHAVLAMVALAQRRLDEAEREVALALELDGEERLALEVRGRLRLVLGRAEEAAADLDAALRARPADADLRYFHLLALLQAGEVERAEAALREALARQPRHARTLVAAALLEAARGRQDQARELLDEALAAQPGLAEAVELCRQLGARSCIAAPGAVDTSR